MRVEPLDVGWVLERFAVPKPLTDKSFGVWGLWDGDGLVVVFGAFKNTMLGAPRIWMAQGPAFAPSKRLLWACRDLVREGRARFGSMVAFAKPGRDQRFAEFCGFKTVGPEDDEWMRLE